MVASIYSTHDVIVWIRGIPRERRIEFLSGQRGGQPCASQQLELLPRPKPISWRTTLGLREEEEDTSGFFFSTMAEGTRTSERGGAPFE